MKYIMGAFVGLVAIAIAHAAHSDYCYYKSMTNK